MFSGQGSQYFQMGKQLFLEDKTFKHHMMRADEICQDLICQSVIEHLYNPSHTLSTPFTNTLLSHPAIFMVEYALAQVVFEAGIKPDYVLGASLGEYAAAVIAGVMDFESALTSVITQAKLLSQHCDEGGMLAVLHDYGLFDSASFLHDHSELAAINFATHFVISGKMSELKNIMDGLGRKEISHQLLPVSYAFHASYVDPVCEPFLSEMQAVQLNTPQIPLVSCMMAQEAQFLTANHFVDVIRHPILFQKTLDFLETNAPCTYVDLGPSGTLATFAKHALPRHCKSKSLSLLTPFERSEKLKTTLEQLK